MTLGIALAQPLAEQLGRPVWCAVARLSIRYILRAGPGGYVGGDSRRLWNTLVASHDVVRAGVDHAFDAGLGRSLINVDQNIQVGCDQLRPGLKSRRIGCKMNYGVDALELVEPAFGPGAQISLEDRAVATWIDIKQHQSIPSFQMLPQFGSKVPCGAGDEYGLGFVHGFSLSGEDDTLSDWDGED